MQYVEYCIFLGVLVCEKCGKSLRNSLTAYYLYEVNVQMLGAYAIKTYPMPTFSMDVKCGYWPTAITQNSL